MFYKLCLDFSLVYGKFCLCTFWVHTEQSRALLEPADKGIWKKGKGIVLLKIWNDNWFQKIGMIIIESWNSCQNPPFNISLTIISHFLLEKRNGNPFFPGCRFPKSIFFLLFKIPWLGISNWYINWMTIWFIFICSGIILKK